MLGEKEYPWLESSVAISKTIASLTDDVTTPDPKDLERLFHSCRMEKAVTNETIVLLQHFWQGISFYMNPVAPSESIKQIILRIIDRLIDPQIMQKSDTAFLVLFGWLRVQEPSLNPYKKCYRGGANNLVLF